LTTDKNNTFRSIKSYGPRNKNDFTRRTSDVHDAGPVIRISNTCPEPLSGGNSTTEPHSHS